MPKCPHCGEIYRRGQDRCYACGREVKGIRTRGRKVPVNPILFALVGVVLLVVVIGAIVTRPKANRDDQKKAREVELERVRDSVRSANRAQKKEVRSSREADRLDKEIDKLASRFEGIERQVIAGTPSPDQRKLIGQTKREIGKLRSLAARIPSMAPDKHDVMKDSLRADQRRVRALVSELARTLQKRRKPSAGTSDTR